MVITESALPDQQGQHAQVNSPLMFFQLKDEGAQIVNLDAYVAQHVRPEFFPLHGKLDFLFRTLQFVFNRVPTPWMRSVYCLLEYRNVDWAKPLLERATGHWTTT
ncbi:hypothetical protein N7535_009100 [Penicillium sp. DV-2018c]|nr:hypothetical protein N7535_009100 [Penicillium sp. DV-2018c]